MVTEGSVGGIIGMVTGVFCFVMGYTLFEWTPFVQRLMQDRIFRRSATIGYSTRIGISVLFPVGGALDMGLGIASVSGAGYLMGIFYPPNGGMGFSMQGGGSPSFFFSFTATIIQGALMNVVLLAYLGIVFGICCLVMDRSKGRSTI